MKQHATKEKRPSKTKKKKLEPIRPEHLRQFQFKEGESGNPNGRPRGVRRIIENAANDKLEFWFEWLFIRKESELERLMAMSGDDEVLSAADRVMLTEVNRGHILDMLDMVAPRLLAAEKENEIKKNGIEDLIKELEM